ncbi:MAG TPA: isoprenylcysteine carboxylmethyltransferase family protein [Acidobacteriaceae bacterium]
MGSRWRTIARRIRVPMGFAFAALYLWLAQPTALSLLGSLLLVVPGLWLRGYAAGYVKKNAELTTSGPYAYTRNPLYLGSLLLGVGFAAASRNVVIVIGLTLFLILIYLPVIRGEEEYLRAHFPGFDAYAARVPRLIPRRVPGVGRGSTPLPGSGLPGFAPSLYRKHREYNALVGACAVYGALALRLYFRR